MKNRDQRILDLYLACRTQEDIAKDVGVHVNTVDNTIDTHKNGKIAEIVGTPPESLQYTNLWDFDGCDPAYGEKYPGRLPGQIIENLLWYYTEPFDV